MEKSTREDADIEATISYIGIFLYLNPLQQGGLGRFLSVCYN